MSLSSSLFYFFFFFFFSFFSVFLPPSFPCSLSSYRAMPLVFNCQSSQPFPNKYASKFSHPLWTTCPSALLSFIFFFFFLFFFSLILFLARFLLTVPYLWYLTVNHRNHFQISTQVSFPIRSGHLVPQLFSLFFCFFLFFLFFFLLLFLARFLLTVPCLWYLTVNHRNRFQISTQVSFPIRSGQLVPQLFSLLFFFLFFVFFSLILFLARFLLTVPYLWYLTVNHRNHLQISTQLSFPIRSGQLVPQLFSLFFCFFLFFLFFFLLLFLARFLLTVPCLWYLTVNHRNRLQISTQVSFPIRSGQLVPQILSLF